MAQSMNEMKLKRRRRAARRPLNEELNALRRGLRETLRANPVGGGCWAEDRAGLPGGVLAHAGHLAPSCLGRYPNPTITPLCPSRPLTALSGGALKSTLGKEVPRRTESSIEVGR